MLQKENITTRVTFIVVFILIIVAAFKIVESFIVSIVVGSVLALALKPFQIKLTSKKISSTLSAYLVFVLLVIVVVVPIAFFIRSLIGQAVAFSNYLSTSEISYSSFFDAARTWPIVGSFIYDTAGFEAQLKIWIIEAGSGISVIALREASKIPLLLIETFFALLSCLFLLLDGGKFFKYLHDKILLRNDIWIALVNSFKKSSGRAIWATILGSVAQSFIVFIGFIILDVPSAFLAAGATFIFSFIPIVGPMPVWLSAVVYLYIQDLIPQLVIMIIFGLITAVADNVVRTLVLKKGDKGLHPFVGLVAVLGGIEVFGFFGVLIGPIIIALLISMLEIRQTVSK